MICEILHPIFDAFDAEFRFHGLGCGWNCEAIGSARRQIGNAQNLSHIKQRKGISLSSLNEQKVTKSENRNIRENCCYCKSQIGGCQEIDNAQFLCCVKQRKGIFWTSAKPF